MPVTVASFRRIALALPDTVEGAHHGNADFRHAGLIFASLHEDRGTGMVKVPPARQRELIGAHGDAFAPANGAWGRAGCTIVQLGAVPADVLRDALGEAWQFAGVAAATRRGKK